MTKEVANQVHIQFKSIGENAALARLLVSAMVAKYDLTIAELDEIKVAVSEAVSNAIIHGYENQTDQMVEMSIMVEDGLLSIIIRDNGIGIEDIALAMQANFSSDGDRMGLGFSFMQSFMDTLQVESTVGQGTTVTMTKHILSNSCHNADYVASAGRG